IVAWSVVQAADPYCTEEPDSLSKDRPLLTEFMGIFTDDMLTNWRKLPGYAYDYDNVMPEIPNMPGVKDVKLEVQFVESNEFIDVSRGGVTDANVKAGLDFSLNIAKQMIPAGATYMPQLDPITKIVRNGGYRIGWAWNSIMYTYQSVLYEIVYFYHGSLGPGTNGSDYNDGQLFLVVNKSASICINQLPPPVATPPGSAFEFKQIVALSSIVPEAEIFYRTGSEGFKKYTGAQIEITNDAVLEAYVSKEKWTNSDTISEVYSKTGTRSTLQVTKITGEPLGGESNLTENDTKFIVKLSSPYAALTEVTINISSITGKDQEAMVISDPKIQSNALVFIDTVDFFVSAAIPGNSIVEANVYDNVSVSWNNPFNIQDTPSVVFPVKPAAREAKVYFSDSNWVELTSSLSGKESTIYVVVEDAIFDPTRLAEYVITLSNKKGTGNASNPDQEVFSLTEITPGKYGVRVEASQSPPVFGGNGRFEIRIGDELKVVYINPINKSEKSDIIGYGIATQQPGQIMFTNEDRTVPPILMAGNLWDANAGKVYLQYSDDYIASLTEKTATITVISTDFNGRKLIDSETIHLSAVNKSGELGIWTSILILDDRSEVISGDGKLQYYVKALITVEVATHIAGSSEVLEGDTARTSITIARANMEESVRVTDGTSGLVITRQSQSVKICVQDQAFSTTAIDTVLLDRIECTSSGDKIDNVNLIQTSVSSTEYCGVVQKVEAQSGSTMDVILSCQDIDNVVARYVDPVFGTEASVQATIMDATVTKIQFLDMNKKPVSRFSEQSGESLLVLVTAKTPDLYKKDTLRVKLKSDSGDTL
ncbi:MAG: hypothetical protein HQK83_20595, partial [Fibrobacteria bacterium]|nr:hypothetical protein [Fibrobacteria bacterium]